MAKILILGSTSPIARALASRFALDGAELYLAARDSAEAARIAGDLSLRTGVTTHSGRFDAADFASHAAFIREVVAALGGLDGVVLCFGTLGDEDSAQTDSAAAIATVHQNFTGAISMLTIAARHLEMQGAGFLIVIGSVAGDRGRARNYVYGSAKGALALFTQGLRGRLAKSGVHVMTVKLGTVDTRMTYGREGAMLTVSPERAADAIFNAWRRKAEVVYVPWFWRIIMGVLKVVPEKQFKRVSF
jgi:decaprenylphospho-beta-D-erythro-pentofuranosid-2-ulose 2-reductase